MEIFINIIFAIIAIVTIGGFVVWLFALIYAFIKEKNEDVKLLGLFFLGLSLIGAIVSQCAGCTN